jgi:HK97 family phage prohead protease
MKRLTIPFEIKSVKEFEIEGYGSTFGNVDLGGDVVMPGAFASSIARHSIDGTMPKMLWGHDAHALPIGVWEHMEEDDRGLYLKGRLADTQMGKDVRTLAKMRAVDRMSIGYSIVDAEFRKDGAFMLKELELWEVSVVNFPMNPEAAIVAAKHQFRGPRELERHLRNVGCSKNYAVAIASELMGGSGGNPDAHEIRSDSGDEVAVAEKVLNQLMAGMIRLPNLRN